MLKSFLKAHRPPKVLNEMKCTNEKMTWNTQDTNRSSYVPKANVDHTISGQGTGITTLDYSATTPRAKYVKQCIPYFIGLFYFILIHTLFLILSFLS